MPKEGFDKKRIDTNSARYKFERDSDIEIKRRYNLDNVFGYEILKFVRRSVRFEQGEKEITEEVRTDYFSDPNWAGPILHSKAKLKALKGRQAQALDRFIESALGNPAFKEELKKSVDTSELEKSLGNNDMFIDLLPAELYVKMLILNQDQFKARSEEFTKEVPEFKRKFVEKLKPLMESGVIPLDPKVLEERLEETKFYLADELTMAFNEAQGFYDIAAGAIFISANIDSKYDREDIFRHEMFHALSGRAELQMTSSPPEIKHQKVGFNYFTPHNRFRWMNEAVTEFLTIRISYLLDSNIYWGYRDFMNEFLAGGKTPIPLDLVLRAYFENFNTEDPERVPAWKKLREAINQSYSADLLIKLDDVINPEGDFSENYLNISKATEILRAEQERIRGLEA